MTTKKLLVGFDPNQESHKGNFVIPWNLDTEPGFLEFGSGKIYLMAYMVYLGTEITENDLFAKLFDSGTKIANVEETLQSLSSYIAALQNFKIGNVVQLIQNNEKILQFQLVAVTPSGVKKSTRDK